jgi:hypothetical protein
MSPKPHDDCSTEIVTLLATPTEGWKLRSNDDIVFGDESRLGPDPMHVGKFLGNDVLSQRDLGDNIAEEGVLSQSGEVTFPGPMATTEGGP